MLTEAEMNARLAPVEALEVRRIERDLRGFFGTIAPVKRLTETTSCNVFERTPVDVGTEVEGWTILRTVSIGRHLLPVEGSPVTAPEDDGPRQHRDEILRVILAAYESGVEAGTQDMIREAAVERAVARRKAESAEGDPDVLWQHRVHAALGDDVDMHAVSMIELRVRAWSDGNSTFERVLKGLPGWRLGGQFVPLHAVLDVNQIDLRTIVEIAIARSREVRKAEIIRFKARMDSDEVEEDDQPSQPSPILPADTARPETVAAGRAM